MKSYKRKFIPNTSIRRNEKNVGKTLETVIAGLLNNSETIKSEVPLMYTERNEGVKAGFDIRTDRFDIALEAKTVIEKSQIAKREAKAKNQEIQEIGKPEPTEGNETSS